MFNRLLSIFSILLVVLVFSVLLTRERSFRAQDETLITRTGALKELLETQQELSRTQGERVTELEKTAKSILNNFLELKEENGELRAQLNEFLDSWTPQEQKIGQATWYGDFFDGKPTRYCGSVWMISS